MVSNGDSKQFYPYKPLVETEIYSVTLILVVNKANKRVKLGFIFHIESQLQEKLNQIFETV